MILAIDVGNTNIVLGGIVGDKQVFSARLSSDRNKTADQYALDIQGILAMYKVDMGAIEGGILSSVVPYLQTVIPAAVAARAKYKTPIAIVDMGTATTLSVVAKNGNYIGGMIIPGLWTSMNALSAHAAQLPYIDLNGPAKLLGTNTVDCMRSGALIGTAAMLDGLVDRLEEELGETVSPVLTGGVSPLIIPYCRHTFHLEPDILVDGLRILYNKNKGNA